jgi:hypothetical protein
MFKTNRFLKVFYFSVVIAIATFGLGACGGGGGGGAAPAAAPAASSPTTKAAGVTYNAFTEDRVSEASVTFDIDGGLSDGTTTYTLASTANGGCSFLSNPSDPTTPVCSPIAGGQAFLLCNGTTGDYFDTVLFNSSVVAADVSEIKGLSLSNVSCGSPSFRTATWTIDFNADGTVVEKRGASSNGYPANFVTQLFSSLGMRYFDYQHRFVLRKLIRGSKTTFFLIDLYENVAGTQTVFRPKIYVIEK